LTFAQWKTFGTNVLVTSNINNWIQCTPGTGSLVTLTSGSVSCQVAKVVATNKPGCANTAPNQLSIFMGNGPAFSAGGTPNGLYYFFDGNVNADWPTHDPCGQNNTGPGVGGVANAGGAIYVR
jgi:hypothetical protein